jgi:hypothetical protein
MELNLSIFLVTFYAFVSKAYRLTTIMASPTTIAKCGINLVFSLFAVLECAYGQAPIETMFGTLHV